jgi:phosphatidylglycerophosphate synthase
MEWPVEWPTVLLVILLTGHLPLTLSWWGLSRRRPRVITPADRVTVLRAGSATLLWILVLLAALDRLPERSWWLVAVAAPTLLLDAVDGAVARRTGTASAAGARFDQELDAGVVLILSVGASLTLGPWVLVIGALRYVYAAVGRLAPWLEAPLPRSRFRRVVAGIQGAALTVTLAPGVPERLVVAVALAALALLLVSFGGQAFAARAARPSRRPRSAQA